MRNHLLMLATMSFLMAGCQSGQLVKQDQSVVDNGSFMRLWNTYGHCRTTTDFEPLMEDALVLSTAANRSVSRDGFVLPLPGKLQELVTSPSSRLAVDVKAMSAACSLHVAETAVEAQRFEFARELLQEILENHPQPDYAFYSLQAKAMLANLDVQVSLKLSQSDLPLALPKLNR